MPNRIKTLLIILFLSAMRVFPQEVDIIPDLKEIENGNRQAATEHLLLLEKKSPNDPSVKFLKGVLTEDGEKAADIYTEIVKKNPRSKYADASLYRLYTYYYALGSYDEAGNYLRRLKKDYPQSPYIKLAAAKIPENDDDFEEAVAVKSKTAPKQDKHYVYTIQAGAFSNPANAASLKTDFEKSGFQSEVKEKTVAGTTFQVVYVGKFETEAEAKSFLQLVNSEFKLNGRVVNIN
jgi:tetratricopeptide (TPR) repeat protein